MFNYKIIFLINVLLSVVYFSTGNSSDDEDDNDNYYGAVPIDKTGLNDYTICALEMMPVFGRMAKSRTEAREVQKIVLSTPTAITCVKKAISKLKLFGENHSIIDKHVKLYYEQFHFYIDPDYIQTPQEFCSDKPSYRLHYLCLDALKIFERDMKFDHLLPVAPTIHKEGSSARPSTSSSDPAFGGDYYPRFDQGYVPDYTEGNSSNYAGGLMTIEDLFEEEDLTNYASYLKEGSSTERFPEEPLTENFYEEPSTENFYEEPSTESYVPDYAEDPEVVKLRNLKMRILKNALYYHKNIRPIKGVEVPNDMKISHHLQKSHGQDYMLDISNHIVMKQVSEKSMPNPWKFCKLLYKDQDLMCDPRLIQHQ